MAAVNNAIPKVSVSTQMTHWVHYHPETTRIVLSVLAIVALTVSLYSLFVAHPSVALIAGTAGGGGVVTLLALAALLSWSWTCTHHHRMDDHVYEQRACEGGRLYYEGDLPVLDLRDAQTPYQAGYAHGYLCGAAVNLVTQKYRRASVYLIMMRVNAARISQVIQTVKGLIEERFKQELEGLIAGYTAWRAEHPSQSSATLTVDDLILFHLIPNWEALSWGPYSPRAPITAACTTIAHRNLNDEIVIARNLDWESLDLLGTYTLLIRRSYGGQTSMDVGIPSIIGVLTGMNSRGLCVSVNAVAQSASFYSLQGTPTLFCARRYLEECVNAHQARYHQATPLTGCHITVADPDDAYSIHFKQTQSSWRCSNGKCERELANGNRPLITLNYNYYPAPELPSMVQDYALNRQRQQVLEAFFNHAQANVSDALSQPFVNNSRTVHRVFMEPARLRMQVAFDNAFAGEIPMQQAPSMNA